MDILLKFSKEKEYLDQLVEEGKMRFSLEEAYAHQDSKNKLSIGQHDKHEGADYYSDGKGSKISIDGREFKVAAPYSINFGEEKPLTYIYSMSLITQENIVHTPDGKGFDERMWEEFGDYMIAIPEPAKFIDRISNHFTQNHFRFECRPIEYFKHDSFSDKITYFNKSDIYKYQNEYRLILQPLKKQNQTPESFDRFINVALNSCLSDIVMGPFHKDQVPNTFIDGTLAL